MIGNLADFLRTLPALLDQLDQARAKATPGPWAQHPADDKYVIGDISDDGESYLDVADAYSFYSNNADADAALIVAAVNALPKLTAVPRAVLAEHRPMANSPGRVPACPDCLGGINADDPDAARSCGCWGLSTPVCSSCAGRDGARLHPVQWPCPTVQAIGAVLAPLAGQHTTDEEG